MAYADLTAEEQKLLGDFMTMLRPYAIAQGKLLNLAAAIGQLYGNGAFAILNKMQQSDLVPDATGLAGAAPLTAGEIMQAAGHAADLITKDVADATRVARRIKLAGPINLQGT